MDDDNLIPLSALQHYLYCPRQFALIHLERLWAESRHTAEGRLMHERANVPGAELRHGVRTVTAMPLSAPDLGISGVADVVEFHQADDREFPYPVEYKRGRPKAHRADEVQLCAQALCLERMTDCEVQEGALFYGKTRRRKIVRFDAPLRALTLESIRAVETIFRSGATPSASYDPKLCDACSLIEHCRPKELSKRGKVVTWVHRLVTESG